MIKRHSSTQQKDDLIGEYPSEEIRGEEIMKYFLLVGNELSEFYNSDFMDKLNPRVLSSYSIEGDTEEFRLLKKTVNNDSMIRNTIFPIKADFLNDIKHPDDFDELEEEFFPKHKKPFYHTHAYTSKEKKRRPHIYHCQLVKNYSEPFYYEWYFHILLFYEDVKSVKGEYLFVPKAMVIITHEPYVTLVKDILETIYSQSLLGLKGSDPTSKTRERIYIPIEVYVVQYFNNIKKVANSYTTSIKVNTTNEYKIYNIPFLNVIDLNLSIFFQIFNLNECLFLMHKRIKTENIIISSPFISYLCPIYIILDALLHPLDISDNTFTYKFVTIEMVKTMYLPVPSMLFIYTDKLEEKFIKALCIEKSNDIAHVNITRNAWGKIQATKFVYKYNGDDAEVTKEPFPKDNLIKSVLYYKDPNLLSLSQIFGQIRQIQANEEKNEDSQSTPSSIFVQGDYIFLQKLFFGAMVNFFSILIPQVRYQKKKDNKVEIIINVNEELDKKYNIKGLETAPINDLIYNEQVTENSTDLKTRILFSELLKISKKDQMRIYFDDSDLQKLSDNYTQDLTELKMLDYQQFFFLNKFNRFLHREINKANCIFEDIFCDQKGRHFMNYHSITFYFNIMEKKPSQKRKNNNLYLEMTIFYYLYLSNSITYESKKEIACGLVGLVLVIFIQYELRSTNINFESTNQKVQQLFQLFKLTKGFYQKFNFLLSFLYDILGSHKDLVQFKEKLLEDFDSMEIDIPLITWLKVKNEKEKMIVKEITNKKKKQLLDFEILSIELVENALHNHIHVFDFEGDVNGDFTCIECVQKLPEQLFYSIMLKERGSVEVKTEALINPKFIFQDMLKNLIKLGSEESIVLENINRFYRDWKDHLIQAAIIAKQYFNISLFLAND